MSKSKIMALITHNIRQFHLILSNQITVDVNHKSVLFWGEGGSIFLVTPCSLMVVCWKHIRFKLFLWKIFKSTQTGREAQCGCKYATLKSKMFPPPTVMTISQHSKTSTLPTELYFHYLIELWYTCSGVCGFEFRLSVFVFGF